MKITGGWLDSNVKRRQFNYTGRIRSYVEELSLRGKHLLLDESGHVTFSTSDGIGEADRERVKRYDKNGQLTKYIMKNPA